MENCSIQTRPEGTEAGETAVYERLVKKYYGRVFTMCYGMLGSMHDAEDVAQEVMLKGFMKMKAHKNREWFEYWVLRVAKNLCIDQLRKRKRRQEATKQQREPRPESRQQSKALGDMEDAVGRLPLELRAPLMMYYFDGRNAMSIAEGLKISHGTACQRLREARRELHDLMAERAER